MPDYSAIISEILTAADPHFAVKKFLRLEDEILHCGSMQYSLQEIDRIIVVGAGKASGRMAQTVEEILGDRIETGLVIVKDGYTAPCRTIRIAEAAHPIPDERAPKLVHEMAHLLGTCTKRDLVLCCISGGGSALMAAPITNEITLDDIQFLTTLLLRCGAEITEINTVRKHLMRLSGGRLAALAAPARVCSLIISDIVGSPLSMIASGPTAPDTSTCADALNVLERYDLINSVAPTIISTLRSSLGETPKSTLPFWSKVQNLIIADNSIAAHAAAEASSKQGFTAFIQSTSLEGNARKIGKDIAEIARSISNGSTSFSKPCCLIWSGETTVEVRGNGKGGRNQELALSAALGLEGLKGASLLVLATDGTDGPTDAAGAIVNNATTHKARELGLNASAYLESNDSYTFLENVQCLIKTGATNTNVNDVVMLFWE